jgi:hypothetical protein
LQELFSYEGRILTTADLPARKMCTVCEELQSGGEMGMERQLRDSDIGDGWKDPYIFHK